MNPLKAWWRKLKTGWRKNWYYLMLLVLVIATLRGLFCSESLFDALTSKDYPLSPNDYLTHLGHFRQGLLTLGGGLVGVLVAWRGYMNLQLEKDKLQTEKDKEQTRIQEETKREQNQRFAQAVGLLGHEAVAVRTGAIYSLQQLMVEAPEAMGLKICRLLAGYVNEHGPKVKWETTAELADNAVLAALQLLAERQQELLPADPHAEPADNAVMAALQVLAERDLPDAVEQEVDFNFAKLDWGRCDTRAHGFYATDVYASKAFFERTKDKPEERRKNGKLAGKAYFRANLKKANLQWANLKKANLQWANLQEANLQEANLQAANLKLADLRLANLRGAKLQVADLRGAKLQVADLRGAKLQVADLQKANLRGSYLQAANLQAAFNGGADSGEPLALTFEDLKDRGILWCEHTIFPDGTRRNPDGTIIAEEPTP